MFEYTVLDAAKIRDISADIIDQTGRLKILPASFYRKTTQPERSLAATRHALYSLPTCECVEWLSHRIKGRTAIEIGSGNGVLAETLNIPATDNRMQEMDRYKSLYSIMAQPVIRYGNNVETMAALDAARKYRPDVIIASWVTHLYSAHEHWRGGNEIGVDEKELLKYCAKYIFIGNLTVHKNKPIFPPDEFLEFDWLYSRAFNSSPNFIGIWKGSKKD